jgi:hypothetical protein
MLIGGFDDVRWCFLYKCDIEFIVIHSGNMDYGVPYTLHTPLEDVRATMEDIRRFYTVYDSTIHTDKIKRTIRLSGHKILEVHPDYVDSYNGAGIITEREVIKLNLYDVLAMTMEDRLVMFYKVFSGKYEVVAPIKSNDLNIISDELLLAESNMCISSNLGNEYFRKVYISHREDILYLVTRDTPERCFGDVFISDKGRAVPEKITEPNRWAVKNLERLLKRLEKKDII